MANFRTKIAPGRRSEPNLYKPAHPPTKLGFITTPPPIKKDHNHSGLPPKDYRIEHL